MNQKDKLQRVMESLCEESRLENIDGEKLERLIELVHEAHRDCLHILDTHPEINIDDLIGGFRGLIGMYIQDPQLLDFNC